MVHIRSAEEFSQMVVSGVRGNFKQEHNIHLNHDCCSHNPGLTVAVNKCGLFVTSVLGIVICANPTDLVVQ